VVEIGGVYPLGVHFNHPARVVLDSLPCAPSQWERRPKNRQKSKHKTKTSPKGHCDGQEVVRCCRCPASNLVFPSLVEYSMFCWSGTQVDRSHRVCTCTQMNLPAKLIAANLVIEWWNKETWHVRFAFYSLPDMTTLQMEGRQTWNLNCDRKGGRRCCNEWACGQENGLLCSVSNVRTGRVS
jgi:hypothetical protein